ncbi:MAG: sugar phosphate isomerase/epimerase [Anaerolineaceae bacterium]|nr:sugar phosphate isomerase/epimerase [Anaerolineaceae bacterium]
MKLSIAIQTPEVKPVLPVALASGSLSEKLAKAAGWGAQGIEFMSTDPHQLNWTEIKDTLYRYRLEASAVASGGMSFGLGLTLLNADPDIMALAKIRLFDLIDMAFALAAPVVTIGSFRGRQSQYPGNGPARLAEILWDAGQFAQPKGVRIALEPINRYEGDFLANAEEGLSYLRQVNHPAVGLLLDTYHMNIEETSWTEPFRKVMAEEKLFHVHLGDNNRLPPGKGLIDFSAIVNTLAEINYTGYLSAELFPKPDPDTAARQTIEYMKAILVQRQTVR